MRGQNIGNMFMEIKSYNKYGAKKTVYNGVTYHSKFEAEYAKSLDWRVKAKDIRSWDRQVKISLDVNETHICNYFIDFLIIHNNGKLEYVEIKGVETPAWKLKWKLFLAIFVKEHPKHFITLVKRTGTTHY